VAASSPRSISRTSAKRERSRSAVVVRPDRHGVDSPRLAPPLAQPAPLRHNILAQYAPVPAADACAGFGLGAVPRTGYARLRRRGRFGSRVRKSARSAATGGADAPASSSVAHRPRQLHAAARSHWRSSGFDRRPRTGLDERHRSGDGAALVGQFQPTGRSALGAPVFAQGRRWRSSKQPQRLRAPVPRTINQSRATIDSQYKAALADVGAREANAQKALGLLPGQVNAVYANGRVPISVAPSTPRRW